MDPEPAKITHRRFKCLHNVSIYSVSDSEHPWCSQERETSRNLQNRDFLEKKIIFQLLRLGWDYLGVENLKVQSSKKIENDGSPSSDGVGWTTAA